MKGAWKAMARHGMSVPVLAVLLTLSAMTLSTMTLSTPALAGETLDRIRTDGFLRCGVVDLGSGLSTVDKEGKWTGFYTDICRAVAAAVTGDQNNVEFKPLSTSDRFDALRSGAVDMLSESSSWTLSRDGDGLTFATMYLYDGQGFLARHADRIATVADLAGKEVCVHGVEGSTMAMAQLKALDQERGLKLKIKGFQTVDGAFSAFFDGHCLAVSADVLVLAAMREKLAPEPDDHVILEEHISKHVLGPVLRQDDAQWADVVRWTIFAMIAAEELGVDAGNVVAMRENRREDIRLLLGVTGHVGRHLGLDRDWIFRIIRQVGNYGEVYNRNLGKVLKLERGPNAPWTQGGLLWAPSIR